MSDHSQGNKRECLTWSLLACILVLIISACDKKGSNTGNSTIAKLSYGDSVFYLQPGANDYIVTPVHAQNGTYTVFPEDGLNINQSTGAINVSRSESGLRYKVFFRSPGGDTSSTVVVISGVNYLDKYYNLSAKDTLCVPVYNAEPSKQIPAGAFDDGGLANNSGCSIKTTNGVINLAQTVRNGLFGTVPQNDVRKEVEIKYRISDRSNNALNSIKVKLYYYNTAADVPEDLKQTIRDHEAQLLRTISSPVPSFSLVGRTAKLEKPRPPCVVIIAH